MSQNYYVTLGVAANASAAEIRAAYLRLMRECHPDRNPSPEAGERARTVIAAFKVLSDFDQRSHYDWARRRERERAVAEMTVPDRTLDKNAVMVGGAGAVIVAMAMAAWSAIMPAADALVEPARVRLTLPVTEARPVAQAMKHSRLRQQSGSGETIIRMRPVLPVHADRKPTAPTKATLAAPAKSAERKSAGRIIKSLARPDNQVVAKPVPEVITNSGHDMASIDQFVMSFYDQSWRVGDTRRRAALEQSRSAFTVLRAGCAADACRRAAYLKLQRDVSSIVESGTPAR